MYIYCVISLGNSSANIEDNIYKQRPQTIFYLHNYQIVWKWIFFIPKVDIIIGMLSCSPNSAESRCKLMLPISQNLRVFCILLAFLNMLSFIIVLSVNLVLNNMSDFFTENQIKSRFSYRKLFECIILIFSIVSSYPSIISSTYLALSLFLILGVFYLIEFYFNFPLLGKTVNSVYLGCIFCYCFYIILLFVALQISISSQIFFLFLIFSTFLFAVSQSIMELNMSRIINLNIDEIGNLAPFDVCSYFEEILMLSRGTNKHEQVRLLGCLEQH